MSIIELNESNLEARVEALRQSGKNLEAQAALTLNPTDETSTITANENSKLAFQDVQNSNQVLSAALIQSANNIKGIGDRFFAIDEAVARSWRATAVAER